MLRGMPEADSAEKTTEGRPGPVPPGASRRGRLAFWAALAAIILAGAAVITVVAVGLLVEQDLRSMPVRALSAPEVTDALHPQP
jgi:hypothetical protein